MTAALLFFWLFLLGGMTTPGCSAPSNTAPMEPSTDRPYALESPAAAFALPNRLDEISGLTVYDDTHLAALQDEDGKMYLIEMATGEVVRDVTFAKDGDYEGIERVGDRIWALRSDGSLYEIDEWEGDKGDSKRHKTDLSERYDTEGLAYDAAHHRLLIACKEYAGKNRAGQKTIYAFDLEEEELLEEPVFSIEVEALDAFLGDAGLNNAVRRLTRPVAEVGAFKPSALAIHPVTQQIYVISSVRKVLVVLESDGTLAAVWPLPPDRFAQPEGLAFLPNGDLFISNEAAGGTATLLRFTYHPKDNF